MHQTKQGAKTTALELLLASIALHRLRRQLAGAVQRPDAHGDDGSGPVDYDEIESRIRQSLARGQEVFAAEDVQALLFLVNEYRDDAYRARKKLARLEHRV